MTLINNNNSSMQQNTAQWLIRYRQAGFSFLNTLCRDKNVYAKWKKYQTVKPTDAEIKKWLDSSIQNYVIVCGEISGIIVIDVDPRHGGDPTPFQNRNLLEVKTPSGGSHFYIKYDPVLKESEHENKVGILKGVDIQSNKCLAFAPPTKFTNQPAYEIVHDNPIIPLPEDLMVKVLDCLQPEKDAEEYTPYVPTKNPLMGRPGDIFNALASWDDVLIPHGWKKVGRSGVSQYWRRPGNTQNFISASTNWNDYDLFFPFTTSIPELTPRKGYTKFNLYATLNHGGDYKKAASALVMENYKLAHKLI